MIEIHEALRRWAKGLYPLEAGVELLIRTFDGRFANPSQPWVQEGNDPGWWWIDAEQMTEASYGALSGGETRLLRMAASLLGGAPIDLSSNLAGLDREHLRLVLACIAHANAGKEPGESLVPDIGELLEPSGGGAARQVFGHCGRDRRARDATRLSLLERH